jgi:predicted dehydrogenase
MLEGAIVGFGRMAEHGHVPAWQRASQARIKAVVDPRPERIARAKEILGDVRTYAGIGDLFEAEHRLDFVDIVTPPPFHGTLIAQCLENGIHVLCEKPFVATLREFKRIRRLVERRRRTAFPVHNWKYAPILAKAIDCCASGTLGKVIHSEFHTVRTRPAQGLTSWRETIADSGGGGIMMDHGWHAIYILSNLTREKPVAVTAWMAPVPTAQVAERSAHLFIEYAASTASLYLTWEASHRHNAAVVYGTNGRLLIDDDRFTLSTAHGSTETIAFTQPLSHGSHHPEWFDSVIRAFIEEAEAPERHGSGLDEVYTCLVATLGAYASAKRGNKRISLTKEGIHQ